MRDVTTMPERLAGLCIFVRHGTQLQSNMGAGELNYSAFPE